ncbi:MAG TPA: galactokinase family protein [Candidatus Acidoferrales bacterium]|nr:galactokinase family protein [Candidatus Acidoferrales bacterium]
MSTFGDQLRAAGMSAGESAAKDTIFTKLLGHLREQHDGTPNDAVAFFVPGRVELAGKHTDYAGGRSLVCAIERGICLVAAPRSDALICLRSMDTGSEARFRLGSDTEPIRGDWSNYAITLTRRIAHDFPHARTGADIILAGDLPRSAGMSSSSALIIAVFSALAEINSLEESDFFHQFIRSREDLAGYLGAVECGAPFGASLGGRGVGTLGGSEDHVAILCSRAGFVRQYSYCPIHFEREIRFPENDSLVIGVSGIEADKTGNALDAYNRASLTARKILEVWRSATCRNDPSLAAAIASAPEASERMRNILDESSEPEFPPSLLLNRLSQFAEESNEIIPAVADALAACNLGRVGALMDRSQHLAETCLDNQTPETIELARSARALGALAASAFGAGFGGSVWTLVESAQAETFRHSWANDYRKRFPARATTSEFLITRPGPSVVKCR